MTQLTRHRLSFDVSTKTYDGLNKYIPYGLKGPIFEHLADQLIEMLSDPEQRSKVLADALQKRLTAMDLINAQLEECHATT